MERGLQSASYIHTSGLKSALHLASKCNTFQHFFWRAEPENTFDFIGEAVLIR